MNFTKILNEAKYESKHKDIKSVKKEIQKYVKNNGFNIDSTIMDKELDKDGDKFSLTIGKGKDLLNKAKEKLNLTLSKSKDGFDISMNFM